MTCQVTSRASPAGTSTVCASSVSSVARGVNCTFIGAWVVLRTVMSARKASPPRTSGGRPLMICKSCVAAMVVRPVPNRPVPLSAMATMRKLVSASFSGTSMVARPCASSCSLGCHSSSVPSSSRVGAPPPSPPAGTALRP